MGGIALELADKVVVTSDNPRTEDPEAIIDEIFTALQEVPAGKEVFRIATDAKLLNMFLPMQKLTT